MEDLFLDGEGLDLKDPPRLAWVRARDAVGLLWRENPKLHHNEEIANSIRRHSFQEPGKFDANLFRVGQPPEDGEPLGAVKAGNGRYEMVAWLEANWEQVRADEEEMPRGLGVDGDGAWCVPVLVVPPAPMVTENPAVAAGASRSAASWSVARLLSLRGGKNSKLSGTKPPDSASRCSDASVVGFDRGADCVMPAAMREIA